MANSITALWSDQLVEASSFPLVAGTPTNILTSADIANTTFNSLKLSGWFGELAPANMLGDFSLLWEVDFKTDNGNYRQMPMYQSNPYRKSDQAPERVLILQPNLFVQNLGEADFIESGGIPRTEVYRSQGKLPAGPIRVRLVLVPHQIGTPAAFVSIKASAEVEQYTV